MKQGLGRRLRLTFDRTPLDGARDVAVVAPDPAGATREEAVESVADVEFVAYTEDAVLSGHVRLQEERLTDMLNEHDEIDLVDVRVEPLDGSATIEVTQVIVRREELLLVHATGPRGNRARRYSTRQHPMTIRLGHFQVRGNLHALAGADPLSAIMRRKVMVPLTDAWVDRSGTGQEWQRVGTVVVNRDQIDVVSSVAPNHGQMPDLLGSPGRARLVGEYPGQAVSDPSAS